MQLNQLIVDAVGERAARLYEHLKAAHAATKPGEKITLKSLCERFGWKPGKFRRDTYYLSRLGWIEKPWGTGWYEFNHWSFPDADERIVENSRRLAMRKDARCKPKF